MKVHGSLEVKAINTVGLRVNEGLNAQTLLNDVQLDKYAKKNQYYYVQQDRTITLPNATTIPTGWTISFYSNELSEGVIYLHDVSGTEQYKVRPKRSVSIILLDNSTAAGVWKVIESGAGGVGSRNVVITTDADPLFEVSGGTVTVHPFVASVSDGFEEDGVAVEEIIEFREGTAISAPTTFPSTKYIYLSLESLILEETSKQTGGNLFPKTPEQNDIFYNKIERRNYKYVDGEWTPYPCVAVGEIAWTAENNAVATVYPFNEWWWDDKYGDVRNTVVISSGTVIKSNATEGPNIALATNGISSGEYGNLPAYLQQGFDGIIDADHMWWSLQTGENVNGNAYLGNINLNEKVTTIKLYQAPYASSYVTSVIVQYSSDNGQSWANLQTYELTMPSAFGEASTLVLPDYTPSASYGLRVLANSGVSNPNAAWQIAELELLTAASGNTVEVGNFVATVSDGYDANGLPIDYVVSLPYTQTVNFTEGQAAYIYVDQYGQVFVDAHKQDGGEELPAINADYPEGSLFYSIIQGRNYKVVNGAWVESPCVAVGEVAADGTVKVYDFNDWWWRYYDAENVLAHSFFYQNDDEYTTQITLDQVAPSKDVLSVIVSNTLLFSDMYELSGDGLTVTFLSAIEPGTPIEVRWYLPLGTITVDTTGANKDLSNLSEIGQNKLIPLDGQPGYVCTRTETGVRWMPPVGISIGTVFMSDLKYPYVPEGALEYNGTEVLNADTEYPDFWEKWLTAGRMNTGTYEEYETALTNNGGTCPFYAVDLETKKFKTPIWNDGVFPSSAVTESEMDSYKEAGLPTVPGGSAISTVGSSEAFSPIPSYATDKTNADGYKLSVGVYESTDTDLHYVESGGTASGSDIYGKSDTVQPVSVRKRWFVQVANYVESASGRNIDEFLDEKVNKSGDTMTGLLSMANAASSTQISISAAPVGDITVQPTENLYGGYIDFTDSTGRRFGRIYTTNQTTGEHGISLQLFTPNDTANNTITLLQNNAGQARVVIPTPLANSDTNDAATTAWVRDLMVSGGNIDTVVERYADGNGNWYRLWGSGWLEQGGYTNNDGSGGDYTKQTNVTFIKAFTQTPLQILVSPYTPSYVDGNNFVLKAYNASTSGFVYFWQGGDNRHYIIGSFWYACGQGA